MADADRDYYLHRAEQERERATTSETPDVAGRHLSLARLYELRASDPDAWAALSRQHSG